MSTSITKRQIDELINELVDYQRKLDKKYPEDQDLKYIKTYKEFLVDNKIEQLIKRLVEREKEFKIEMLVVEEENENLFYESELLLEWEQYKKIPKTNKTYRYDKGKDEPGFDDHIHVFLGNSKNQVYAINKSGTPRDGSKAKLSNKEIKFLKSIGFTPPTDGILEWIVLQPDKNYVSYNRWLLFD